LLTARRDRFEIPEAQHQFGGFGGTVGGGITIPIFGSGGAFAGGIRGGVIPGGVVGAGGSGVNPLSTLEGAFGTGFTAQSIADAILVAEQEGRFTTQGPVTGEITITTGPTGLTLVLNLANALFEIFDASGRKLGGGVTPEAALEAVRAGGGVPAAGGGGGSEPLPFPRRSPPLPPLPLSHLRRSPRPSAKIFSARSRHSSPSCSRGESRRQAVSRPYRPVCPSNRYYLVEQSTSPWCWARRVIPPEYVVRVFQTRNNSPERSRSGRSSGNYSRSGKHGRTRTSNAELLSSSSPHGLN